MAPKGRQPSKEELEETKQQARLNQGRTTWYQPPRNVKKMSKEEKESIGEYLQRPDSTRNASIQTKSTNADRNVKKTYQAPRGQQDIATQFQDSYAKQGMQPRGLVDEVGEASPRPQYQQPEQITRSEQTQQKQRGLVKRGAATIKRRRKFKKRGITKRAFTKVRVTAVNTWVWSWGLWSWAVFQVPFAIVCVIFMAIHETLNQLYVELSTAKTTDTWFETAAKSVGKAAMDFLTTTFDVINWLAQKWWGINLEIIQPANLFMLTYLVVLLFGWFTLMLIYFMYKGAFLRPLSGKGSTMKISTFLLALIGYSLPIFNLFPWFIFWTMAVWWNPK